VGNGQDSISVGGAASTISLGSGKDTVHGGAGDSIQLTGNGGNLAISGADEMVFLGSRSATVTDMGHGLQLEIGLGAGSDTLANFATDLSSGVIELLGGIGGYSSATQTYQALQSDGHGGSLLPLGHRASLDILDVAVKQLGASNFHIG
jgi:large repetitive protein